MSQIEYETVLVKVDSVTVVSKQVPKAPEPPPVAPVVEPKPAKKKG